jgi:hypothetical protein
MIAFAGLTLLLLAVIAVVALALTAVKVVVWTVLLPLRLLFGALLLPFLLIKAIVAGVAVFIVGPVLAIAIGGAIVIALVAIAAPLLPLLAVGVLLWLLLRATRGPVLAR